MQNYLLDVNIILDYYSASRSKDFPESVKVFKQSLTMDNFYISSSSLDNIAYLKANYLRDEYGDSSSKRKFLAAQIVKYLVQNFKIAKVPSYLEIDYEDIEDSQIIASAKAVNAKVITRDKGMLKKYPDDSITSITFLNTKNNNINIDFANLKKQYFMYQSELELEMDKVLNNASYIMGDAVKELEQNLK